MTERGQKMDLQKQAKAATAGAKNALASLCRKAKAAVHHTPAQKKSQTGSRSSFERTEATETVVVEHGVPARVPADTNCTSGVPPASYNDQWYKQMMQAKGISR
jgi:hypothetical protein